MIPVSVFRQPPLSPNFPHVLPISRDCLAAPHVPESRIERFIPLCICKSTLVSGSLLICYLCFVILDSLILDSCFLFLFILYSVFLSVVCKSCICIFYLF